MKLREFYALLKTQNYNFSKAAEIYDNLTLIQKIWLSEEIKREGKELKKMRRMQEMRRRIFERRRY